jgi:hypothetical protein
MQTSPAKVAINSDRAIVEKLTGAWLPCQESSALQWLAPSNYRLKAEYVCSTGLCGSEKLWQEGGPSNGGPGTRAFRVGQKDAFTRAQVKVNPHLAAIGPPKPASA